MTESPLINPENRPVKPRQALSVLLIDNQPESRALLKAALRSIQTVEEIREASTTQHVPQLLAQHAASIVLVEQNIENEDVFELVKSIRRDPATANTRFVLMSNHLDTESRRRGIEAGILGYLSKPFDINSLERSLKDSMGKVSTNLKETLNKVRRIEFFSDFTDLELVRLLKICHTRKYQDGETIFNEGEKGDRLYVLIMGLVEIIKHREQGTETLATMNAGDCFGEMALVDQEPRSADARAKGDTMIIEVNDQIINDINDILALKLFRKIAILVTKKLRTYTSQHQD
ncbi:MAG TPA: cyclic nucleotide-binding domain-containing protein [bacterium]|nr:cyclic nucleotide-binding domain-containing protein [bacterium]